MSKTVSVAQAKSQLAALVARAEAGETIVVTRILMAPQRVGQDQRLLAVPDGCDLLPVLPDHCRALADLPPRHRDPFDRMPIAQARAERLALLTRDRAVIAYGAADADIVSFDS